MNEDAKLNDFLKERLEADVPGLRASRRSYMRLL